MVLGSDSQYEKREEVDVVTPTWERLKEENEMLVEKREGAIKHQSYSSCKMDDLQMKISGVGPLGWIKALGLPEVMKSGCHVNR